MARWTSLLLVQLLLCSVAHAAPESRQVVVADPFLELHTGPGRGYPVFDVVGRGDEVTIVKRRTNWFLVKTSRGREGWAQHEQMLATLELTGEPADIKKPSRTDYQNRRWEAGVMAGDFGGASVISLYGAYAFNEQLSTELTVSQVLGQVSDGELASLGLVHIFAPEWRVSPYLVIGGGVLHVSPKTTLVQTVERTTEFGYVGAGLRGYLSRRFVARIEYRTNLNMEIPLNTGDVRNEEVDEWKAGFGFFF